MRRLLWILSLLMFPFPGGAAAQEAQVPLDEAGRVQVADRRLAERLGLWTAEYPGFREARLFQAPDSSFVLEITRIEEGRTLRHRLPQSPAEVAALRARVTALVEESAGLDETGALDQRGRYLLLGQTTLAGVAFYGWALPVALGVEGDGGASGLYLLTAGTSFFLPFALTEGRPVTYGMANLSRYGVTRGIFHGVLLHDLVRGEEPDPFAECVPGVPCSPRERDDFRRGRLATALLTSAAEGVGGYLWARNERMSAGTANAIAAGGDAGLFWGLGTAVVLGGDADALDDRASAAIALPATVAGIVGAHRLAQRRDYTWGDVDLVYTAGAVGALAGFAAGDLLGGSDGAESLMTGAAVLGSMAAVAVGDRLVRNTDFSVGQATLNRLGALAGALAGASLGAMAEEETVALTGAALGAAAGYGLTFSALAPEAPAGRGERIPAVAWELGLHPRGLTLRYRF